MFDMDGLLLDTERVCRDAFIQTAADFSLPEHVDPHAVFLKCVGLRRHDGDQVLDEHIGPFVEQDDFKRHWDSLIYEVFDAGIPVKAGTRALLLELHDLGIPAGVVTSTQTDQATRHLDGLGLLPLLKAVIGGDQVTIGKPDPEGYIKMAAILGVAPHDCAAFEDSNTGIRAAVASGARAVQVPDLVGPTPEVCALGHIIATDLLSGAKQVGLIP